jgi:hypothetical protein
MKKRRSIISGLKNRRHTVNRGTNPNPTNINVSKKIDDVFIETNPSMINGYYNLHTQYEDNPLLYHLEVGFLIIATGKYDIFIEPLIQSIEKYVLPNNAKFYNIFSDKDINLPITNYRVLPIEHRPFPYPTLNRFHFFSKYFSEIKGDQLIYIDADTLITSSIGTEILLPITITQHCGYVNLSGTFETRIESSTYVDPVNYKNYYGGGFYSLHREEFYDLMCECVSMIDLDSSKGIVPIWHDESALNKYFTEVTPNRVLSPSYHYPENIEHIYNLWGGKDKYPCKILLLSKNHKEIRE